MEREMVLQYSTANELLEKVYEPGFYKVAKLVSRNGGSLEDAKDVFHDALIILSNDLSAGKKIDSQINYLTGVARNLWIAKLRRELRTTSIKESPDVETAGYTTISQKKLLDMVRDTGSRCMNLLISFYFEKIDISSLARKFGFASEHSASVQKYKCIEKMRETIKSKDIAYEDFFE
jgi:RNA polymerase sigma factor (sigma-70 family)